MTDDRVSMEFLTPEEAAAVDVALLSSADKFSTRLAIYACRVLSEISSTTHCPIEQISEDAIADWVKHDPKIEDTIDIDDRFINFFTRLVTAALVPLRQISQSKGITLDKLQVRDIITWFERERSQ
ncbi:hypothetical protein [Roseofilum casamattae]|uniref:Uncharacterized protein n=1 Tax=Roseofilum casamattae BLCC-M143 TaxID=3022442 RepID=A0ABT7C1L9_9CYAN|nr:hypothetical protein [Roseofilum casamattae]MDJ1184654.1 hypothetical protein [Roseofilum casamattae BLCC-M143]